MPSALLRREEVCFQCKDTNSTIVDSECLKAAGVGEVLETGSQVITEVNHDFPIFSGVCVLCRYVCGSLHSTLVCV